MASSDENNLTPKDLRQWLQQEVRDVMKASELRIKDATDLVTAYAVGEISQAEAMRRFGHYNRRWREPILGVMTDEGMTNSEILEKRDAAAKEPKTWAENRNKPDRGR